MTIRSRNNMGLPSDKWQNLSLENACRRQSCGFFGVTRRGIVQTHTHTKGACSQNPSQHLPLPSHDKYSTQELFPLRQITKSSRTHDSTFPDSESLFPVFFPSCYPKTLGAPPPSRALFLHESRANHDWLPHSGAFLEMKMTTMCTTPDSVPFLCDTRTDAMERSDDDEFELNTQQARAVTSLRLKTRYNCPTTTEITMAKLFSGPSQAR